MVSDLWFGCRMAGKPCHACLYKCCSEPPAVCLVLQARHVCHRSSGLQTPSTQQNRQTMLLLIHRPVLAGPSRPAQPHVPAQTLQPAATLQLALQAGQAGTARRHCEDWSHEDALPRSPGRASGAAVVVHHQKRTSVYTRLQQGGCASESNLVHNGQWKPCRQQNQQSKAAGSPTAHCAVPTTSMLGNVSQGGAQDSVSQGARLLARLSLTVRYSPWACLATYARGSPSSDRGVWLAGRHWPSWGRWAWK